MAGAIQFGEQKIELGIGVRFDPKTGLLDPSLEVETNVTDLGDGNIQVTVSREFDGVQSTASVEGPAMNQQDVEQLALRANRDASINILNVLCSQ